MEEEEVTTRPERAFDRDWTQGSIVRNLLSLSWPMMVNMSLNMVGPTIDMIWVGRLGPASIAGVGIAGMAAMLVMAAVMGLMAGVRAMVARFVGAGDVAGANHVARQAFAVSALFAILLAAVGIFFAEPIMDLFGVEADVVAEGAAYLRIMFLSTVVMAFRMTAESIMQASGDSMTPMRIAILFRLCHVLLCPFLVLGWWIFPALGVSGAAATNVISQSLGTVLGLWVLLMGRSRLRLTLRGFRLDFNIIWRILRIGLPALVMGMQRNLGQLALMWFMAPFGTLAVAAHSLYQRVLMILVMPGVGLGMGAGVLVGQNLGARRPARAERTGWLAAGIVEGFVLVASVVVLVFPEGIVNVFSTEPGLVEVASAFLRIAVAGYVVLGFVAVFQFAISGAGDTVPPMIFSLVMVWVVQLPLAYLLPRVTELGVYGIRWAIVANMVVGAVAYTLYFAMGRWKQKSI